MLRLPEVTDSPSFWDRLSHEHGDVAIDVGANIGQASRVLAERFGTVYALEPCVEALALLMVEVPSNVQVWPFAVSAVDGKVTLDVCENSIATGQLTTGSALGWGPVIGWRTVDAMKLDTFCDMQSVVPGLVKVDTEGHEVRVLRSAPRLIGKRRTSWFVEVHSADNEKHCLDCFDDSYVVERVDHDFLSGTDRAEHFYLIARPR